MAIKPGRILNKKQYAPLNLKNKGKMGRQHKMAVTAPTNHVKLLKKIKPKSRRVARVLKEREAKVIENPKTAMLLKGLKTNNVVVSLLQDMASIKRPFVAPLHRRNDIHPFDDVSKLEFLSQKNDASLFAVGTHSKKRPQNIIMGRMHDGHVLDMVELGISGDESTEAFSSMKDFLQRKTDGTEKQTYRAGNKPLILFQGDGFETNETLKKTQNLLLDFFTNERSSTKLNLSGIDHALVFTSLEDKSFMLTHYTIKLKRAPGSSTPRVELHEIGPRCRLSVRRTQFAPEDVRKKACWVPDQVRNKDKSKSKNKNVSQDETRDTVGVVHMPRQELGSMRVKLPRALRKRKSDAASAAEELAREAKRSRTAGPSSSSQ